MSAYKALTPEQRIDGGVLKPVSVRTMTLTSADLWKQESAAFRVQIQEEVHALHKQALTRYEIGLTKPRTPLDYHK